MRKDSLNKNKTSSIRPHSLQAWLAFMRPKTFWIAAVPVFVGTSFSLSIAGTLNFWTFLLTLLGAVCIQAMSNMQNDYGYNTRKAENGTRTGLPRATSEGWISMLAAKNMILFMIVLCAVIAVLLVAIGGWPILLISILSVVCAYCYMAGPLPIAYTPFGEFLVLVFYGWGAVCGTYWLQTQQFSWPIFICGSAIGLYGADVLFVNNFRDIEHDLSVGRKTLASFTGRTYGVLLYKVTLYLPFVIVGWLVPSNPLFWPLLFTLVALPRASLLAGSLGLAKGMAINEVMFKTVKLELLFGLLLVFSSLYIAYMKYSTNLLNIISFSCPFSCL